MKTRKLWTTALAAFMIAAFIGGCKDENVETVGLCPLVISTNPANLAANVPLNQVITVTFNEPMNPLTITPGAFVLSSPSGARVGSSTKSQSEIPGSLTYDAATRSMVFTPNVKLKANAVYTGTVATTVKDVAGNALQVAYVWTFSTIGSPTVISTDPANNATNVAISKIITATFSVPMDPLTFNATTFTVSQGATAVAGTVSYTGSTATFTPTNVLALNTIYTGTITTAAKNVAGTALAANYVWTFNTGGSPSVILTDPLDLATAVAFNKVITATFSEAMDPLTITSSSFTLKIGSATVLGAVTYAGTTATFTPTTNLLGSTTYTATVTTAAKNVGGNPMTTNKVWSFTTASIPSVVSTDPLNLAIGVALNKVVGATFSEAMDPLTITATTFTLMNGATPVAGVVNYVGTTATLDPTVDLLPGITYTATITTGAKSVGGIALFSDKVWTFTTANVPMVLSTDPLDLATGVALNKVISATFSQPMDALTITGSTFTLMIGATPVGGAVNYSGSTATFTPTSNLLSGSTYTATITTGAKNLGGSPLASNYVWTFNTVAPLGPVPPVLATASIFGAFGGNAGITNQGLFTMINNGAISTTAASTLVTGFHDAVTGDIYTETPLNVGNVSGGIFTAPPAPGTATSAAIATQGLLDATAAYNSISPASMPGGIDLGTDELGALTLAPGVYKSASGSYKIENGALTLDAQGDANAVWVFQMASTLSVGIAGPTGARSVTLINGALAKNVYWYVGSAATINGAGGGIMVGTIMANSGVTFSTAGNVALTVLNGRAISLVASVTMVNTIVNVPN